MKVGDLVRIKYDGVVTSQSRYDGVVALIVEVEVCQADTDYPGAWFHCPTVGEVIHESR